MRRVIIFYAVMMMMMHQADTYVQGGRDGCFLSSRGERRRSDTRTSILGQRVTHRIIVFGLATPILDVITILSYKISVVRRVNLNFCGSSDQFSKQKELKFLPGKVNIAVFSTSAIFPFSEKTCLFLIHS